VDASSLDGFEVRLDKQPDLAEDVPAYSRKVGLDDLWRSLPSQNFDSMILLCICVFENT